MNRKKKTCKESICESRKIAMPDEINPHGTLFGGVLMSWIDKIGYMCAQNYAEWKTTVTANIDQIQFINPVYAGDHVTLKAFTTTVGRSSMEIEVQVYKEDPVSKDKIHVSAAYMTFVAVSAKGKSRVVPSLLLESHEDRVRYKKAQTRIKMRAMLKKELSKDESMDLEEVELPRPGYREMLSFFLGKVRA